MSLLLFSLLSVVAQAAIPGKWSKNPRDWESKCPPNMHYCKEDELPNGYYRRRSCPKGAKQWLKITAVHPGEGAEEARCEGEFKAGLDDYPVTWDLSFPCDPAEFERREDGDYAKVFVGYQLRHYPRPSKYSKLTERWDCIPAVGAGSLDDLFR